MTNETKKKLKRIIFMDDNNQVKAHKVLIYKREAAWVIFQLVDEESLQPVGTTIELPTHRVLKIKDIKKEENDADD